VGERIVIHAAVTDEETRNHYEYDYVFPNVESDDAGRLIAQPDPEGRWYYEIVQHTPNWQEAPGG
jgi:hypothetical protein